MIIIFAIEINGYNWGSSGLPPAGPSGAPPDNLLKDHHLLTFPEASKVGKFEKPDFKKGWELSFISFFET